MLFGYKKYRVFLLTLSVLTVLSLLNIIAPKEVLSENKRIKIGINNHTGYRLFLDELDLLQDQSHLTFQNSMKACVPWVKFEDNLEKNRRSYDVSFVKLLNKYDICPNDLYGKLDRLWDKAKEKEREAFMKFIAVAVSPGVISDYAIHQGWDTYLKGTKEIAQQLAKDKLYKSIPK